MTGDFERLPKNVKPVHYDVFIRANFDTFKFTGEVTYEVKVIEATKVIKMSHRGRNLTERRRAVQNPRFDPLPDLIPPVNTFLMESATFC